MTLPFVRPDPRAMSRPSDDAGHPLAAYDEIRTEMLRIAR